MAKTKRRYICQACGSVSHRWQGQCPDCAEWNTLVEDTPASVFSQKHDLSSGGRRIEFVPLDVPGKALKRQTTGLNELDRALGGGLVPGSAILMGGDPGIGKSTLLLQASAAIARSGREVVYVSGEEASGQVRMRAERLGYKDAPIRLASATSVRDILTTLHAMEPPALLVIDSIQTMHSDTIEGAPGTVSQVRGCAFELIRYAKQSGAALILVGHVTKDGTIAGPRVLEHMVDVVMSFEGERSHQYRILRALKNRFGAVDEIGVFAMAGQGLEEVPNPSMLFLSGREEPMAGSAIFPAIEGTRPVLIEIQALIVRLQSGATPRRAVVGWDTGRLAMLLAVLESRCGLNFSTAEVYLNVSGGYRLSDPAADLAVAAALVSALADKPLAARSVWLGEVSLAGEVRPVAHAGLRMKEAAKLGFDQGFGPPECGQGVSGIHCEELSILPKLVDRIVASE
ncbi:DNA repair protein RadA [Altericroceibacterium endophyticum]|uniref:DNA repair protein RadA n=1 Tax=Altericroceibacterium endophyticum TaxID=1808508 RepID=A0A6I4T077_9SPHN|nr:DNA repair protein RadA [Altericroceibacterium endophyticum]MXO64484.1 DNA repair protein RadA [Altericroceibacterium endophyticum]